MRQGPEGDLGRVRMGVTMMTNSRRKGKEGELELARILREYGFDARRGQQYSGASGDADVIGLPGIHIECKRVEQLNLAKALAQSTSDARAGERPVVIHRRNGEKWMVTMSLMDFIELYEGSKPVLDYLEMYGYGSGKE